MLEAVLFANIRFHDTISRGRLLNRFGKDFEGIFSHLWRPCVFSSFTPGIDSSLADNFGRTVMYALSVVTTFITVTWVGGPAFLVAAIVLGIFYYNVAKVYGQTSRDMRRLGVCFFGMVFFSLALTPSITDSTTRSPLYTTYSETIAGVGVLRSYGASTKFLREMQQHVDTVGLFAYYTIGPSLSWIRK